MPVVKISEHTITLDDGSVATVPAATFATVGTAPAPAPAAGSGPAPVPGRGLRSPNIADFGAAGDGTADDGPAFSKALAFAAASGRVVDVPSASYAIKTPIAYQSAGDVGDAWGLACDGAVLLSHLVAGEDVLSFSSSHTVRYLRITGGLTIKGNGAEGNGLRLFAAGGSQWLYNALLDGLAIEGCGKSGLLFEGNVFESNIVNCFCQDNRQDGAQFMHSQGGVCSAISILNSYFNQNGNFGVNCGIIGAEFGGATDVRITGGYIRNNGSFGCYYNNGMSGGLVQVGFENNCTSMAPGNPKGAHVYSQGHTALLACGGYNEGGGATYLVRAYANGVNVLESCGQDSGGAMAATGKSGLLEVDGPAGTKFIVSHCGGRVDSVAGTAATFIEV